MNRHKIFIAGGTGYLGSRLIPKLLERGHEVTTLVRKGSEKKIPEGFVQRIRPTFRFGYTPTNDCCINQCS